jgi:hypothetical protein
MEPPARTTQTPRWGVLGFGKHLHYWRRGALVFLESGGALVSGANCTTWTVVFSNEAWHI